MTAINRPSALLATLETRSFYELGALTMTFPFLQAAPRGDGHPVVVYPGFLTSDWSTLPLRLFLTSRNYRAYGWGLGRNYGRGIDMVEGVPASAKSLTRLEQIVERNGRKASLVGWSLGGIYAREIARQRPDLVRQVITMGSPFNGKNPEATNVSHLFERFSGHELSELTPELLKLVGAPPPVPSTAIFTRTDGIAAWECCIEQESDTTENIGVLSSHTGLGFNPVVLWIVANRLAQPEGEWSPFDRRGLKSLIYTDAQNSFGFW
ncbi:MAG: alpha/beta hydrolase [Chloroflexota bacterium]